MEEDKKKPWWHEVLSTEPMGNMSGNVFREFMNKQKDSLLGAAGVPGLYLERSKPITERVYSKALGGVIRDRTKDVLTGKEVFVVEKGDGRVEHMSVEMDLVEKVLEEVVEIPPDVLVRAEMAREAAAAEVFSKTTLGTWSIDETMEPGKVEMLVSKPPGWYQRTKPMRAFRSEFLSRYRKNARSPSALSIISKQLNADYRGMLTTSDVIGRDSFHIPERVGDEPVECLIYREEREFFSNVTSGICFEDSLNMFVNRTLRFHGQGAKVKDIELEFEIYSRLKALHGHKPHPHAHGESRSIRLDMDGKSTLITCPGYRHNNKLEIVKSEFEMFSLGWKKKHQNVWLCPECSKAEKLEQAKKMNSRFTKN